MLVWRHALQQRQQVMMIQVVSEMLVMAVVVVRLVWGLVVEPSRPSWRHWRLPHHPQQGGDGSKQVSG